MRPGRQPERAVVHRIVSAQIHVQANRTARRFPLYRARRRAPVRRTPPAPLTTRTGQARARSARRGGAVDTVENTAVVDLLGGLAYAELTAFDRLAEDARLAPTLSGRAALARMAAAEIAHHGRLTDRLTELGADPQQAMVPFVSALDSFHEGTRPSTWLEGLVKAYVGDGLASDFYREIAGFLAEPDRTLVLDVLADTGHADF